MGIIRLLQLEHGYKDLFKLIELIKLMPIHCETQEVQ